MAYIDRDLLIERIGSTKVDGIIPNWQKPEIKDTICKQGRAIKRIIETQPIADVVEVVRCKDCIYWQDKNSKGTQGICLCGEKDMNYGGEFYPFSNDFCSYGERKEVD